jgi:N-acetylmuramoyl-L-alanine amidase
MRYLFLILLLFFTAPALAEEIYDIRLGAHPDKTRIVIETSGEVDFHASVLDAPKRLVVHLPVKNWAIQGDTQIINPISSIKHTVTQNHLSRLVFNLTAPAVIRNAYMLPSHDTVSRNRLVIDMTSVSAIQFEKEIGKGYGSLYLGAIQNQSLDDLLQELAHNDILPIPQNKPAKTPLRKPIIVIDAGHGGRDPGAISASGIREKDITLPMAKRMAQVLNMSGRYDARLTRSTDVFIKLHNRVKIARQANADIFISVHADSVRNNQTRGASVYTLSDTASDAQTAKLAARENRADLIAGIDLDVEDEDVSMILLDLSMRDTMNQSKNLANTLVQSFNGKNVPLLRNPHRYAGFAVLKAPDVPSILVETGFVSNESEARKLTSPEFQNHIANALLKTLDRYFDTIE